MKDKESIERTQPTADKRSGGPLKLDQLASGILDPDLANMTQEERSHALPNVGSYVMSGPYPGPNNTWFLVPFRVTYKNASKLRISCELVKARIPVPPPPAPAPLAEEEGGRTTLAVDSGVLGGGTKFT